MITAVLLSFQNLKFRLLMATDCSGEIFGIFFHVTVDQNVHLSDIEKFCYLKDRLIGEAKQAISGISVSKENFRVVKTLLKERFEDTQLVIHHHYTDLINLTPATNSSKGLRFVYDKIESNLRSLESLQQDINHDTFISIISSKIPKKRLSTDGTTKGC